MLESIVNKFKPYRVVIVPTTLYKIESDGSIKEVQHSSLLEQRFYTYNGFSSYIHNLEHNGQPVSIKRSHKTNSFTYYAIPNLSTFKSGEFELEIDKDYVFYFR